MPPLVSIVIPAYNARHFLGDALASVANQAYAEWECIVVDDGSTDDTAGIVEHWAMVVRHDTNKGVSAARNRGFAESRGDFIQFLDADDRLLREKLARQVRFLEDNPETGIVYSEAGFFRDGSPERLTPSLHGKLSRSIMARVHGADEAWKKLQHYNILPTPCALLRREAYTPFNEACAGYEDWDFWLRCAAAGVRFDFAGGDEPLVAIRAHGRSASRDTTRMAQGLIAAAKSWPGATLPLIYEVALGADAVLHGDRRGGSARIAAAAARATEPLTAKRWRAYALAARLLPREAFLRLFARPMPEWPLEVYRRFRARGTGQSDS